MPAMQLDAGESVDCRTGGDGVKVQDVRRETDGGTDGGTDGLTTFLVSG